MYISLIFLLALACYVVPHLLHIVLPENDIKKKYGANKKYLWALVTGASAGIGRSIVYKLAAKGINVVLVAKDDNLLEDLHLKLGATFPALEFRVIGVDLSQSGDGYIKEITEMTEDLQISLVFNIAGYLLMDNFANGSVSEKLANIECNVTSVVKITDHFYKKMVKNNIPGAISFASSSTMFCPSPYASIYAAGKAFLSAFAHSLAVEAKGHGVDIFVVHPGAVNTSFYEHQPDLLIFKILRFIGQTPDDVASIILNNLGRTTSLDSGLFAYVAKAADKVVGPNVVVLVIRFLIRIFPGLIQDFHLSSRTGVDSSEERKKEM